MTRQRMPWTLGSVPDAGRGLFETPVGTRPAGHLHGLPIACGATNSDPSALTFLAPPFGS
jgi:hypothetical protein